MTGEQWVVRYRRQDWGTGTRTKQKTCATYAKAREFIAKLQSPSPYSPMSFISLERRDVGSWERLWTWTPPKGSA